jgi:RNA polymerase sigma-70 factor (ECF subfamily)
MVIIDDPQELTAISELLSRACSGDARAFCLLVEPLQTRLLRQAIALSGDPATADDLVSETLIEAWKSLARYDSTCRLSTWLYAILLHRWKKSIRRARCRPTSAATLTSFQSEELLAEQQNIPANERSPSENLARAEAFSQVQFCVERLPRKHRDVIRLRFFADASLPEMATVLGCSIGTVKSRLHHALERLRKMKLNLPDVRGDTQT